MNGKWWSAAVLVAASVAGAEEPSPDRVDAGAAEPVVIETVVTASRREEVAKKAVVATEVIGRKEIASSGARDLGDLLVNRPGLELDRSFAGVGARIQGLSSQYVLVLIDGERPAGRTDGTLDLSRFSLEDIERVEIVKGPSSVLYGADAVAGAINLVTRRANSEGWSGEARLTGGYPLASGEAEGRAQYGGDGWGLALSGGGSARASYDLDPSTPATNGSDNREVHTAVRAHASKSGPWRLDGRGSYTRRLQNGVDQAPGGAILDRRSADHLADLDVRPRWQPEASWALQGSVHASLFHRLFLLDQRNATSLDVAQITNEGLVRSGVQLEADPGGGHSVVAGIEGLGERIQSPRIEGGHTQRGRASVHAQDSWKLPLDLDLSVAPGVRLDLDSRFGPVFTPRLGSRFALFDDRFIARVNAGLGFRAPSFQEQYLDFENPGVGYVVRGNPNLKPEKSRSLEVRFESDPLAQSTGTFRIQPYVELFLHDLTDLVSISAVGNEGTNTVYGYVNVDHARSLGGTAGLSTVLPKGFGIEAAGTVTRLRDGQGSRVEGQAPWRVNGRITWRDRDWKTDAWVRSAVTGPRPVLQPDLTLQDRPAWVLLDARAQKCFDTASMCAFLAGENLTGAGDPTSLPLPPRTFLTGVSAKF